MPSQFEPCGLSQMIAMRYGTIPIVRETGGLRDTVLSYNEFTEEGNGFTFFNYNAHDMLHVIERATDYYHNHKDVWNLLQKRGMTTDFSWTRSANRYVELYRGMIGETELRDPSEPEEVAAPVVEMPAEPEKPKKRTTRKAAPKTEASGEEKPKKRAPAKKAAAADEAVTEEKPKKRTTKKTASETEEKPKKRTTKKAETADGTTSEEQPKKRTRKTTVKTEAPKE